MRCGLCAGYIFGLGRMQQPLTPHMDIHVGISFLACSLDISFIELNSCILCNKDLCAHFFFHYTLYAVHNFHDNILHMTLIIM